MSDIQLFPFVDRGQWSEDELADAVQSASAHVQYLLRELSQDDVVLASRLKSKKVAYAIVQRICNSKNREALVQPVDDNETGQKAYRINPKYREQIVPLVKDAPEPPETPAIPPRPKRKKGLGRMRKGMSAIDGIAIPSAAPLQQRRITQSSTGRSISFPSGTSLEFCQELMGFLNASGNATRYRIVLDTDGPRLEVI